VRSTSAFASFVSTGSLAASCFERDLESSIVIDLKV
jgi:hypothetical protein